MLKTLRLVRLTPGPVNLLLELLIRGAIVTGLTSWAIGDRWSGWLSAMFGVLVFTTAPLGVLHATGLWFGIRPWTAPWTHALFGFALLPLFVWHLVSRPVQPRPADLDRRAVLRTVLVVGAAAAVYGAQESLTEAIGLPAPRPAPRRHARLHRRLVEQAVMGCGGAGYEQWVTTVEPSDRPAWLQSPLPLM